MGVTFHLSLGSSCYTEKAAPTKQTARSIGPSAFALTYGPPPELYGLVFALEVEGRDSWLIKRRR